jgi:TonB family protein
MSSDAEKVKGLLQAARVQIQQGARDEALKLLREALGLDPSNSDVIDRIASIEREIAAMEKFNRSRSNRTHTAGRTISSTGFVEDCLSRSGEAFEAGDEIRALQELERARRHDPDNEEVRKRIRTVRRSIKVNSLADLVTARLRSGDPALAVENIRRIFRIWPGAPVLDELVRLAEEYREIAVPVEPQPVAAVVSKEPEVAKPIVRVQKAEQPVITPKVEQPVSKPKADKPTRERKPEKPVTRPKLEKPVTAPKADKPVSRPKPEKPEKPVREPQKVQKVVRPVAGVKEKEEKAGSRVLGYVLILVAVLVVGFLVVKFLLPGGGGEPEPIPAAIQPFTQTLVIPDLRDVEVTLDGVRVSEGSPGVFMITDSVFGPKSIQVSASGMENFRWDREFTAGMVSTDTLHLDSLGTHQILLTLGYMMPDGVADPGIEAVSFTIDDIPIEGFTDSIRTGMHVIQAQLEGFRTMPDSILVVDPIDLRVDLSVLDAQQSQISISLATDTPGNASFFINGNRVATARRITEVLPFGTYTVRVSMEDREEWTATVNLGEDGYSRTISLPELVTVGTLLVGPEPWSDVYVDGVLVGTTPFGGVELSPGAHTVRLSNPGFQDDVRTVQIVEGESTSIQFAAVPVEELPEEITPDEDLPVSSPFAIQQTIPGIPAQAQARGDLHGYVTLAVRVGIDGSVLDVQIVNDPLGLGCGQAAQAAVRNWVYSPAMQGGEPVEVTTNVQVRFDIE